MSLLVVYPKSIGDTLPIKAKNSDTKVKIMPKIPAIPKPGITNNSISMSNTPTANMIISQLWASPSIYSGLK